MNNFNSLEVVGRGSETQLEVGQVRPICDDGGPRPHSFIYSFIRSFVHLFHSILTSACGVGLCHLLTFWRR